MIENSQLKEHMAAVLGEPILTITSVAGGDIAQSYLVTTRSQYKVFAKTQAEHGDMLLKEAVGLKEIAASGAIRVPQVLHVEHGLLVLEAIVAPRRADTTFFRAFGAALARMHKVHADFFGFHEDNYIGSTEQKNLPKISYDSSQGDHQGWARFFFEYRLLFQYRLLERKGYTDDFKKAF